MRKFLGFVFSNSKDTKVWVAKTSLTRLKERIKGLTRGRITCGAEERIRRLNLLIRGWLEYFKIAQMKGILEDLGKWIRRRLTMCLLRQWKKPKTKIRELKQAGMSSQDAKKIASSGKGPWRLAGTQIRFALNKEYWKNQGLIDVVSKYAELQVAL